MPYDGSALASYISTERAFRGIGPVRAKALHDEYGNELYTALLECWTGVVRMIGEENAIIASAAMRERVAELDVIDALDKLGLYQILGPSPSIRIARAWGSIGAQTIRENPYCLLSLVSSSAVRKSNDTPQKVLQKTWFKVDRCARHLGVGDVDPRRVTAAIEHVLQGVLEDNDTMILTSATQKAAGDLLGFPVSDGAIEACVASGGTLRLADWLQPVGAGRMEVECALILCKLAQQRPSTDLGMSQTTNAEIEAEIETYESGRPFRLTEAQSDAVKAAHLYRFFCLAGYDGSGKTTVLRAICDTVEVFGRSPIIMTLSGRAAQRASESTGREAITIAKFMAINDKENTGTLGAEKVVIVDEASMCSLPDIWRILKRLGEAQLILCGDPAQLPPISFGLIFHVLASTPAMPSVTLDRVMRQREDSGIPAVAEAIRFGPVPVFKKYSGAKPGVTFNACLEDDAITLITRIDRDLQNANIDPNEVQIIDPIKLGKAGVTAINKFFHDNVVERGADLWPGYGHIAEGEPLIWTKNDRETGFTNGSLGRVTAFEADAVNAVIDGQVVKLDAASAGMMTELAYAITVHKSQGSQWPVVIVPCFKNRLMDRSMIYTAITRAQEQVILVGDHRALVEAIEAMPAALRRKVGFPTWLSLCDDH